MRWRLRGAVVALAIALQAAGCVQESPQATAGSLRPTAEAAATRWDPGAQLIGVEGWESKSGEPAADGLPALLPDPAFGDGRAPMWVYTFQAGIRQREVWVAFDGAILAERDVQDCYVWEPLRSWEGDSDMGVAAALAEQARLQNALPLDVRLAMADMLRARVWDGPQGAVWVAHLLADGSPVGLGDRPPEVEAEVPEDADRQTGKFNEASCPPAEAGEGWTDLDTVTPTHSATFRTRRGHEGLQLQVATAGRLMASTVEIVLTAPGGVQVAGRAREGETLRVLLADAPAGDYSLDLRLPDGGLEAGVAWWWCTEGWSQLHGEGIPAADCMGTKSYDARQAGEPAIAI